MQSTCPTLYCHLWPVWLYYMFPYYLLSGMILKEKLLNVKCMFWFSLQFSSEIFLILRTEWDTIINVQRSSRKLPVIHVRFEWHLNFLDILLQNTQIWNFMKICPVGPGLFLVARQTDCRHDEANSHVHKNGLQNDIRFNVRMNVFVTTLEILCLIGHNHCVSFLLI